MNVNLQLSMGRLHDCKKLQHQGAAKQLDQRTSWQREAASDSVQIIMLNIMSSGVVQHTYEAAAPIALRSRYAAALSLLAGR